MTTQSKFKALCGQFLRNPLFATGHVGIFVTLTCPSKYHAGLHQPGTKNLAYNNSTPREAQAYLQSVWERIRAKSSRNGVRPYGFRIAEPHHDGCPHWHMLLLVTPENVEKLTSIMTEYALAEDCDEPGAKMHRIKIVRIDASKGGIAGYIAKYVGKNIDEEIVNPSQRVKAWATQWGIRQLQSIGTLPVTVWRELARNKKQGAM